MNWFKNIIASFTKTAARFWETDWEYIPPITGDPQMSSDKREENAKQRIIDFYFLDSIEPEKLRKSLFHSNFLGSGGGIGKWEHEAAFYEKQYGLTPDHLEKIHSGEIDPEQSRPEEKSVGALPGEESGVAEATDERTLAWENAINNIKKAKQTLTLSMVRDYSEDLRFSLSCELRHTWGTMWDTASSTEKKTNYNFNATAWIDKVIARAKKIHLSDPYKEEEIKHQKEVKKLYQQLKSSYDKRQILSKVLSYASPYKIDEELAKIMVGYYEQADNNSQRFIKKPSDWYLKGEIKRRYPSNPAHFESAFNNLPQEIVVEDKYPEQIKLMEKSIGTPVGESNEKKKVEEEYLQELEFKHLNSYSWKVLKDPNQKNANWNEWKKDQLKMMSRFILDTTPAEWEAIKRKMLLFEKYLNDKQIETPHFGDHRDQRYRSSLGYVEPQYFQSYLKGHKAGLTNKEMSVLSTGIFLDADWSGSFGGPNWATIAKGLYTIQEFEHGKYTDMLGDRAATVAVDFVHNLQHNSGSAFTKVSMIYGNSGFFQQLLDLKAQESTTIEVLWQLASEQLKEIGQFYIFNTGRPAKESAGRVQDWNEFLRNKSIQGTLCDYLKKNDFSRTGAPDVYEEKELADITGKLSGVNIEEYRNLMRLNQLKRSDFPQEDTETEGMGFAELSEIFDFTGMSQEQIDEFVRDLKPKQEEDPWKEIEQQKKQITPEMEKAFSLIARMDSLNEKLKISELTLLELGYTDYIDWTCLAQNRFLDQKGRIDFFNALSRHLWHKELDVESLKPIYKAFYSTQKFHPDEIKGILTALDMPFFEDILFPKEASSDVLVKLSQMPDPEEVFDDPYDAEEYSEDLPIPISGGKLPADKFIKIVNGYDELNKTILIALAQNPNLSSVDDYFQILRLATERTKDGQPQQLEKPIYRVISALAKNAFIANAEESKDVSPEAKSRISELKQILESFDIPEEEQKPKVVGGSSFDEIDLFASNLRDLIAQSVNASSNIKVIHDTPTGKGYEWILDISVLGKKIMTLNMKEGNNLAETTYFHPLSGTTFIEISPTGINYVLEVIKSINNNKPVQTAPGVTQAVQTKTPEAEKYEKFKEWVYEHVSKVQAKYPFQFSSTPIPSDVAVRVVLETPNKMILFYSDKIGYMKLYIKSSLFMDKEGTFNLYSPADGVAWTVGQIEYHNKKYIQDAVTAAVTPLNLTAWSPTPNEWTIAAGTGTGNTAPPAKQIAKLLIRDGKAYLTNLAVDETKILPMLSQNVLFEHLKNIMSYQPSQQPSVAPGKKLEVKESDTVIENMRLLLAKHLKGFDVGAYKAHIDLKSTFYRITVTKNSAIYNLAEVSFKVDKVDIQVFAVSEISKQSMPSTLSYSAASTYYQNFKNDIATQLYNFISKSLIVGQLEQQAPAYSAASPEFSAIAWGVNNIDIWVQYLDVMNSIYIALSSVTELSVTIAVNMKNGTLGLNVAQDGVEIVLITAYRFTNNKMGSINFDDGADIKNYTVNSSNKNTVASDIVNRITAMIG